MQGSTLDGLGFTPELRAVRIDAHALAEKWQRFLAGETSGPEPDQAQTIELLHLLWLIPAQRASRGDHDWATIAPVETHPAAAVLWRTLRERLRNPADGLTQEELLRQPVFIPHRPLKDPREIRLLDPACGSMHFGLYAFDLFTTIYAEAWDLGLVPPADFGAGTPPFPHDSVRVNRRQETVHSNDTHQPVTAATARVVLLNTSDPGDGMWHPGPFLTDGQRTFRPGTAWEVPWTGFDYGAALAAGRFTPEAGERLVRDTPGAWEHDRMDALSAEAVRANFDRQVPRLIIEHNLHGIDIDPRAAQIAGLSLWLRAQRAWHEAGVRPADRPRITRANVVCAEPMPGERARLRAFVEEQFPARERPAFGYLLEKVFDRMTLAGEAGSLLRIEEEIRSIIAAARALAQSQSAPRQTALFPGDEPPAQEEFDLRGLDDDEAFWHAAEQRIYDALQAYAEGQAEDGGGFQRRLFANDAARGFAFIDLCRKHYDVVVMNPPFGAAPKTVDSQLKRWHPEIPNDLFCQFVQRGSQLAKREAGKIGCITNNSFIIYNEFQEYRQYLIAGGATNWMLDLGEGVLDAYVGAAAYVFDPHKPLGDSLWIADLRKSEAKAEESILMIQAINRAELPMSSSIRKPTAYQIIPGCPLCHWAPNSLWDVVAEGELLGGEIEEAGVGAAPVADFFRVRWEVPPSELGFGLRWVSLANAGYFSTFYRDDYLAVDWKDEGRRAKADLSVRYPYLKGNVGLRVQRQEWHGRAGLVFGRRTDRFTTQPLCCDSMFSFNGIAIFPRDEAKRNLLLALLNSRFVAYYINLICGLHKNDVYVRRLPGLKLSETQSDGVSTNAQELNLLQRQGHETVETSTFFIMPVLIVSPRQTLLATFEKWRVFDRDREIKFISKRAENDAVFEESLGIDGNLLQEIERDQGPDCSRLPSTPMLTKEQTLSALQTKPSRFRDELSRDDGTNISDILRVSLGAGCAPAIAVASLNLHTVIDENDFIVHGTALVSWMVGCAFGHWDIRYATGERPAPELPDPFAALPVCPPGMLQGDDGLPLAPDAGRQLRAAGRYPLDVAWEGILVDDPEHPLDLEGRLRAAPAVLWGDRADALEQEACALLGVPTLREWFRRPAGFFADHLKRYSKSRRQAPIYWPLSTASGRYTLWLYYPRLSDQTLYACVNEFVAPRLTEVAADVARLRAEVAPGTVPPAATRARLEALGEFGVELEDFRRELLAWAPRWRPDLNDGVLITACPLWRLFRLPRWRKDLQACWEALETGKYDWAHLAHTLFPDRVREKCRTDRSLAIAHGLEELCEVAAPKPKAKRGRGKKEAAAKILPVEDEEQALA